LHARALSLVGTALEVPIVQISINPVPGLSLKSLTETDISCYFKVANKMVDNWELDYEQVDIDGDTYHLTLGSFRSGGERIVALTDEGCEAHYISNEFSKSDNQMPTEALPDSSGTEFTIIEDVSVEYFGKLSHLREKRDYASFTEIAEELEQEHLPQEKMGDSTQFREENIDKSAKTARRKIEILAGRRSPKDYLQS
jgi:hypothetical protein